MGPARSDPRKPHVIESGSEQELIVPASGWVLVMAAIWFVASLGLLARVRLRAWPSEFPHSQPVATLGALSVVVIALLIVYTYGRTVVIRRWPDGSWTSTQLNPPWRIRHRFPPNCIFRADGQLLVITEPGKRPRKIPLACDIPTIVRFLQFGEHESNAVWLEQIPHDIQIDGSRLLPNWSRWRWAPCVFILIYWPFLVWWTIYDPRYPWILGMYTITVACLIWFYHPLWKTMTIALLGHAAYELRPEGGWSYRASAGPVSMRVDVPAGAGVQAPPPGLMWPDDLVSRDWLVRKLNAAANP